MADIEEVISWKVSHQPAGKLMSHAKGQGLLSCVLPEPASAQSGWENQALARPGRLCEHLLCG
jgi:hypothetical protein